MMLYVSKNGNFENNTIPFFAKRLEHLEAYLSNFIRFLCTSSLSSSASSPTVVAALHAFAGAPARLKEQFAGNWLFMSRFASFSLIRSLTSWPFKLSPAA